MQLRQTCLHNQQLDNQGMSSFPVAWRLNNCMCSRAVGHCAALGLRQTHTFSPALQLSEALGPAQHQLMLLCQTCLQHSTGCQNSCTRLKAAEHSTGFQSAARDVLPVLLGNHLPEILAAPFDAAIPNLPATQQAVMPLHVPEPKALPEGTMQMCF